MLSKGGEALQKKEVREGRGELMDGLPNEENGRSKSFRLLKKELYHNFVKNRSRHQLD